jgi:hypothetical protein
MAILNSFHNCSAQDFVQSEVFLGSVNENSFLFANNREIILATHMFNFENGLDNKGISAYMCNTLMTGGVP